MARRAAEILSHWHKTFEGFQDSPQKIYGMMEEAVKRRQIPDAKISRVTYRERGIFSAKREYLRVKRENHIFDICAAPYGIGFFFSWWLGDTLGQGPLSKIWHFFKPSTYYSLDTAMMFRDSVHTAVLEIIEQLTEGKGIKAMTEQEKKPFMEGFFTRR